MASMLSPLSVSLISLTGVTRGSGVACLAVADGLPGLRDGALPVSAALGAAVTILEALCTLAAVQLALGNTQAMDTPGGRAEGNEPGWCVCVCAEHLYKKAT